MRVYERIGDAKQHTIVRELGPIVTLRDPEGVERPVTRRNLELNYVERLVGVTEVEYPIIAAEFDALHSGGARPTITITSVPFGKAYEYCPEEAPFLPTLLPNGEVMS